MPAPPPSLVTALRGGPVAVHLFFYLDHPSGAIRVWDGVGQMIFGGNTYDGVGGLASVEGVSNSADLQNHSPTVTLNRVPLTSLQSNTSDVRNRAATITFAAFSESGALMASRVLFSGVGDCMMTRITEDEASVKLKLRGKIEDWALAPRAYYTPFDQASLYPSVTDTGLSVIKSLENANISGWSVNTESSGGNIGRVGMMLRDSGTGKLMHANARGGLVIIGATGTYALYTGRVGLNNLSGQPFLEETTGASTASASNNGYLNFSGANAYVDTSGDGRTAGGKLIYPNSVTVTNKVKRLADIASTGSTSAETVDVVTGMFTNGAGTAYDMFKRSTGSMTVGSIDTSAAIINNSRGILFWNGSALGHISNQNSGFTATTYVEEVTGTAMTVSGGKLKNNGVNCGVSSTGVVYGSTNRKIIPSGGDASVDFLRIIS